MYKLLYLANTKLCIYITILFSFDFCRGPEPPDRSWLTFRSLFCSHSEKVISDSFQIDRKVIVVTVFLLIMNPTEFV